MVGGRVVLSADERARLDGSLALVEAALPALSPVHSLQQGLSELLHFAEEDPACCDHIVRSTATLKHTHALLRQAIAGGRHADESFALAILAPLLRLLRDLAVQSQSKHVFDVLTKQDGATAVVVPMLTSAVGTALEPFVRFVTLLLSGPEGEGFRSALWSSGAAACIAQRQQQQQQQYEASSEALRRSLANLTSALVGWPRIPSTQDVDVLSSHTFAIVADLNRCDAPSHPASLRAATALLLANPSAPSAHTRQCIATVAPALGNAVLRAAFGENSSPELASAAIAFVAAARSRGVDGLDEAFEAVAGSPASGAVLDFAERVLATLPDVKRGGGENTGAALAKLEALVRSVPPALVDLHRHVLVGTIDAVRALIIPLLSIDSGIGAGAARLMAFVVQANPPAASRFVDLGGPGILLDMLKDYDAPIIAGALMLLAALTAVPSATQAIIHWHLLERIVRIFRADVCGITTTASSSSSEAVGSSGETPPLPPLDLSASVLLYLRQLATCPGLRGAPPALFADFTNGLIALLSNLLCLLSQSEDGSVVDLLVLAMDTSGAVLLSSWPMTDAAVSAAATSFADAAVAAFLACSTGADASIARASAGLIAASSRAGGPSSRAQIAFNGDLIAAFASRLALSPPSDDDANHDAEVKAAAAVWSALAALTSSCAPAVDAIAAHASFASGIIQAALTTCHRAKSALAFTDDEDTRGAPQVVLVACPVLEFIGHVAKSPEFQPEGSLVAVTELVAVIASHPRAPLPLRASAVDALQSLSAVAPIDNVAHHLLAVLLSCEDAADDVAGAESARMLANRAFKLMITDAPRTMHTLFTIATEAFAKFESKGDREETPYRSPTRRGAGSDWRWAPLDEVLDRDDAHDLLVVLLPLLNGCLNQERNCSVALLEEFPAESWQFFLAVIANDSTELGLKIVSVLGLGNLINHCRAPADALHLIAPTSDVIRHLCALHATLAPFNPLLSSALEFAERNSLQPLDPTAVSVTLERVHALASMGMPAITAIADALEILYYVAERVVMLSRGVNAAHAVWSTAGSYLVRAAVRDVHTHHTARSFLLVAVQEAPEFMAGVADGDDVRRELALGLAELGRIDASATGTQQQVAAALAHLSNR